MIEERYGDYKLNSYDSVRLTLPEFNVSDDETNEEMNRIASRHAANVTIEPHPVCVDDMVQIDIETNEENGGPFPGLTRDAVDVQLGVGSLPPEIEIALIGHVVGDIVTSEFDYTDYSEVATHREKPADGGCGGQGKEEEGEPHVVHLASRVKLLAIRKLNVPEITDEWVKKNIALSNTTEEFRKRTEAKLTTTKRRDYMNRVEYDIIAEMGKRLVDEPPEETVDAVAEQLSKEFDNFLKQYEISREEYLAMQDLTEEEFGSQLRKDAYDRVAQDIALASYAKYADIAIDDSDINSMFSQPTPEKTYESRMQAEQTGEIVKIKDLALRMKTTEALTRSAIFMTADGEVDQSFTSDIEDKYEKLQAVRRHVTAEPMLQSMMS